MWLKLKLLKTRGVLGSIGLKHVCLLHKVNLNCMFMNYVYGT